MRNPFEWFKRREKTESELAKEREKIAQENLARKKRKELEGEDITQDLERLENEGGPTLPEDQK